MLLSSRLGECDIGAKVRPRIATVNVTHRELSSNALRRPFYSPFTGLIQM